MRNVTRRNQYLVGIAAGLFAMAAPSVASATQPLVLLLDRCELDYEIDPGPGEPGLPHACGPQKAEGFTLEQGHSNYITHEDGSITLLTIFMSSRYYVNNNQPTNMHCTAVKFTADQLPQVTADKQLTDFDANRSGHPFVINLPGINDKAWFGYQTDRDNNNPRAYVAEVDALCNMGEELQISNNDNANNGAVSATASLDGEHIAVAYGSQNIGAYVVTFETGNLEILDRTRVINNGNQPRPTIIAHRAGFLTSQVNGNNRPNRDEIQVAYSLPDGTIMFKKDLAQSDPENDIYVNNPSLMRMDNDTYGLLYSVSAGTGKNNNVKGASGLHLHMFEASDDGILTVGLKTALGSFQTHGGGFAGLYGPDGERAFGLLTAPITGNAPAIAQMGFFRDGQIIFNESAKWVPSYIGDSGHQQNLYGQNPNNQGRGFLRATTDIPNPAFGNPNGFWPNVKTMIATPHSGRINGDFKNAMWLGILPGETTVTAVPEAPQDLEDAELGVDGEGEVAEPEDFNPEGGGGEEDPDQPGNPNTDQGGNFGNTNTGGCACSTPGTESTTGGWAGALALLGLAGMMASRRRKES